MPRISAFYGIVVTMYSSDHAPPHFHARYGEYEAQIIIDTGDPLAGQLPIRALRLIREWDWTASGRTAGQLGARPGPHAAR
jgi:hypothetical protein